MYDALAEPSLRPREDARARLGSSARSTFFSQGNLATNDVYLGPDANTLNTVGGRWGAYLHGNAYDADLTTGTSPVIQAWRTTSMTPGLPVLDHMSMRVNGVTATLTRTSGGTGNGTIWDFAGANHTWVGYPRASSDYQLAEVLVWSRALSAAELGAVEGYLATRYGIPLSSS